MCQSCCLNSYYFILYDVETNDLRSIRSIAEVAMDSIFHRLTQFFQGFGLGEDVVTESASSIAAVGLVFADFEDDFCDVHGWEGSGYRQPPSKAHKNIVCSRPGPTDAMVSLAPVSSAMALR